MVHSFLHEYDAAIRVLSSIPPTPSSLLLLGQYQINAGTYGAAKRSFREAIQILKPTNPFLPMPEEIADIYVLIGTCEMEVEQYRAALGTFTSALQINPRLIKANLLRGYCELRLYGSGQSKEDSDMSAPLVLDDCKVALYGSMPSHYLPNRTSAPPKSTSLMPLTQSLQSSPSLLPLKQSLIHAETAKNHTSTAASGQAIMVLNGAVRGLNSLSRVFALSEAEPNLINTNR
ncbi:unnamed protein product [Protopolystoma xenopodis]|uniref:Uncharacterized protein n=1 Tax=Protopolystoma xenopodis TaxID=117903 RepID=A0A448XMQ3_9PLAT|nr:unnamed protein product [Protopolystoma xenopodis]